MRFCIINDPVCCKLRLISNASGTSVKCYSPKSFPSFKAFQELSFRMINACPQIPKTVQDFCSVLHMQLIPWAAYTIHVSPFERMWDLVGWRLARYPCPAASKGELCLCIQAIWNSVLQEDIRNLFNSMPRHTAALIAVHGNYTKY